jgi:hypothetical protein
MKKNILSVLLICLAITLNSCGPQLYKVADFDKYKSRHKIVAILPFSATLDARKTKGQDSEAVAASIKKTGYDMQNTLFSELLRKFSKDKYIVEFQDVNKTNALLTKGNITYDDIALKDKGEICKLLGVDAVISGTVRMTKPMSDGAGIALALLGVGAATNKTDVSLSINDAEEGKLLWKYDWQASGSIGSSSESLGKGLARSVSRQFPYQK